MNSVAKLIHVAAVSYLPTKLSAQYYGMPDGKVHLIFARFYKRGFGNTGLEYVFAWHKEFYYDYENEKLFAASDAEKKVELYNEEVDKPNPRIIIKRIYRKINSFAEARSKLNELHEVEAVQKLNISKIRKKSKNRFQSSSY